MEFEVIRDDNGHYDHYEGDDTFSFEASGVLLVILARSRRRVYYSPAGWVRLEADSEAEPKGRGHGLMT
jgi:hypothetical protein